MEELSRKELLLCSLNRQYLLEKGERMQVVESCLVYKRSLPKTPATPCAFGQRTLSFSLGSKGW